MPELNEIYVANPVGVRRYVTLQFLHSAFTKTHRIVINCGEPVMLAASKESATLYEFIPVPGEITLPKIDDTGRQDLAITLDNVSLEISQELDLVAESAPEKIVCIFAEYVSSEPERPQNVLEATLINPNLTDTRFVANAVFSDLVNLAMQSLYFTPTNSPGLAT